MKLWLKFKNIFDSVFRRHTSLYVSSSCFYLIISFIPSILLLLSAASLYPSIAEWGFLIQEIVPSDLYPIFKDIVEVVNHHPTVGLISVSGLVTIWSASKGILSIRTGLDHVMESETDQPYIRRRLRAICSLLPLLLLGGGVLLFFVFGESFITALVNTQTNFPKVLTRLLKYRFLYASAALFLILSIMYRIVPTNKHPFRDCLIGGVFTASAWQIVSGFFSIYVRSISSYRIHYGSLGVLFLGLIWLQISIHLILIGGRLVYLLSTDQFHPIETIRSIFFN